MTTIGYATLQIIPSLKGVSAAIDKELAGVSGKGRAAGRVLGDNIAIGAAGSRANVMGRVVSERDASAHGARIGRAFGLAIGGAASAGIAGIGYTLTKGFQRLQSIDQAQFKLKALGHSGEETKTIMDNATSSVKGTAFSLADAATAAASAVAAGIQPGKDLTKYLGEVGDAAAIAGTNFDDMGAIFNKIQTSNKAYTDDLQQLSDRGLPIFQWLQKEYGVTGDALSKMVQDGEVDAAHFQAAIADNIGGAAQNMGQSFQGAVENAETAIARVGAHFLGSIFGDKDGSQLAGPTEAIGALTEKFDQIDAWVVAHGPEIRNFFTTMADDVRAVATPLGQVAGLLLDHPRLVQLAAEAYLAFKSAQVIGSIATLSSAIGTGTGPGATGLVGGVFTLAAALGVNLGFTIFDKMKEGAREAQAAIDETNRKLHEQFPGQPVTPTGVPKQTGSTAPSNPLNPNNIYGPRAMGGAILGAGTATSDSIPALLSNGEHVLTAADVKALGGQAGVYALRSALHRYADGGAVGGMTVDQLKKFASGIEGHGYVWGGGNGDTFDTDCSGAQSTVANFITGGKGRFATATESGALLSRGFKLGDPPPGVAAYWVGWLNGGPGGGHTAGTIVDPVGGNANVEMGGRSGGGGFGPGAAGAAGFPNRAWIAVGSGDDPSKNNFSGGASPFAGGSAVAAATGGGASADSSVSTASSSASSSGGGGGGSLSLPSSLSGFGAFAGGKLGDLAKLGEAAGSVVDGQVASVLDVFGIPSDPPWLKAISTFIGGISIGGGGSAGPLAATPTGGGVAPPDDPGNMHGGRAGQAPGPTYNITARDTEDAFVKAQRVEREKAAAKLSRF